MILVSDPFGGKALIFLHQSRSAGLAVCAILQEEFGLEAALKLGGIADGEHVSYDAFRATAAAGTYPVYMGHFFYGAHRHVPRPCAYFTMLRDPVDRLLSRYERNYDAFRPLVVAAREAGVKRFIYASSSSVYGIKNEAEVTEDLPLEPLTDYSRYKALCEHVLAEERRPGFATVVVRPSTVCGYAPRLRLDLTVNILTNHAVNNGRITVFGGAQKRPNIHIDDMVGLYLNLLDQPDDKIDGQAFNAGYENHTVMEIAEMVREALGRPVDIVVEPTDDDRSYHVSSAKMRRALGFEPAHTIAGAVRDLKAAFDAGRVSDPLGNPIYFNIKQMQRANLR